MNKISRQLIRISKQIIAKTKWEDVIRKHLQELKEKKIFNSIKQFAIAIDVPHQTVTRNLKDPNSELNQLLKTHNIQIIKDESSKTTDWKKVIEEHKQKFKEKKIFNSIRQFAIAIDVQPQTVVDNFNKQDSELNKLLKENNIQIIKGKSKKTTDWKKVIKDNLQKLQNNTFNNIKQFADAIEKNAGFVRENFDQINEILNNDEFKNYNIQIIKRGIDWKKVIKDNLQKLQNNTFNNIKQFATAINKKVKAVQTNFDQINEILNNDEFKNYNIQIIKDESRKKTIWKDVIKDNLQKLQNNTFNITQFADVIKKKEGVVWKSLDQINEILNNDEFKNYNIQIIKGKSKKTTDWKKVIKDNLQKLQNNTFNITQFADVIKKKENVVWKRLDQINEILNNDEFKNYNIQIIKDESRKKTIWKDVIKKHKQKLKDRQMSLKVFSDIIHKSDPIIRENFEEIKPLLDEIKCTLKYEKSWLQYSFQEAILELDNVVRVDTQVGFDGKSQLSGIENLIKRSRNILNRKNQIAKKIKLSTNNDDKESESLDRLNNLLNNLTSKLNNIHRAAFDFYVETEKGNKYLIQCQGEDHYNINKGRNKNIIVRILIDSAKMLFAAKHNCNFIATYDVKAKKKIKESLDVFNDFYMTTEEAIQLIEKDKTVDKRKVKRCAITMINRIRKKFEVRIDQLSNKIKDQLKTNKEILEQIRKY